MSGLELRDIDRDHLGDLRRKGRIPLGPDGHGVPVSIAIRLQMAGLATISRDHPQHVSINRGRAPQHRSF